MRKPIIAGNWKMHFNIAEAVDVVTELDKLVTGDDVDVMIFAPYLQLPKLVEVLKDSKIKVGAQNMHYEEKGAYTGEIAPGMLLDIGVKNVIIGHSERRQYFNETDETCNLKLKAAYEHGIDPIFCVGESLEEREGNKTTAVLNRQVEGGLKGVSEENILKTVIAYEPIWAIGTGKTATSEQANDTIKEIRNKVADLYGKDVSEKVRIQYGGSVKPGTIKEQMAMSDIDGALVGGASLVASDFSKIVNF